MKMKTFALLSVIIVISQLNLGCGNIDLFKVHSWKEKYSLKPNTGILTGKISVKGDWKGKRIIIFVKDSINGKLAVFDTLDLVGHFLIKNLKKGKYIISANELVNNNTATLYKPFDRCSFAGSNCQYLYLDITPDIIKHITATVPGGFTDEMAPAFFYKDTCKIEYTSEELNEANYLKILH
jgi:hypothetical protein